MTRSYSYEAASTSIQDIYAVIFNHFNTTSIRYTVSFNTTEGFIISTNGTAPEIIPHQISLRHDNVKIITAVDRLSGFTGAGNATTAPAGGSGVASPEVLPLTPTIGSTTVYITEEADCITILTYEGVAKRQSDWGCHCGIGFIPAGLNDDTDYSIYGTINLNGKPEITTSSSGQWMFNTGSNSTGIFEGIGGLWYAIYLPSGVSKSATLNSGGVFIPRPMVVYTRQMADSASYDFILGYMKYIFWMPGNDAQFPRTKAENVNRAYLYFDGNSDASNCVTAHLWEQGVVPG